MNQSRLDLALHYAANGIPVLPLHYILPNGLCTCGGPPQNAKCKPGKHPYGSLVHNGVNDATTDNRRLRHGSVVRPPTTLASRQAKPAVFGPWTVTTATAAPPPYPPGKRNTLPYLLRSRKRRATVATTCSESHQGEKSEICKRRRTSPASMCAEPVATSAPRRASTRTVTSILGQDRTCPISHKSPTHRNGYSRN